MRFWLGLCVVAALSACVSAPLAQARLSFFAINVTDADVSAAWYARTFGVQEAHRFVGDAYDIRILTNDEVMVELVELTPQPPTTPENARGIAKAGFEVTDLNERAAAWRAAGVRFYTDGVQFDETMQLHYLIIHDPDGNLLQVFTRAAE